LKDAVPDKTGAPYPAIIFSHRWLKGSGWMMDVNASLPSNGFVVVSPTHNDTEPQSRNYSDT